MRVVQFSSQHVEAMRFSKSASWAEQHSSLPPTGEVARRRANLRSALRQRVRNAEKDFGLAEIVLRICAPEFPFPA